MDGFYQKNFCGEAEELALQPTYMFVFTECKQLLIFYLFKKRFLKNVLIRNTEPENNMKYEQTDLWPAVLEVESNIYVYFYLIF